MQLNYKGLGFPDPSAMNQQQLVDYLATPAPKTYTRPGQAFRGVTRNPDQPFQANIQNQAYRSNALQNINGSGGNWKIPQDKGYTSLQHQLLQQFYPDYLKNKPALQGKNLQEIMSKNKNYMPSYLNSFKFTPEQLSTLPMGQMQQMIHKAAMINYKEKMDGGGPLGGLISPASVLGAGLGFVGAPMALRAATGAAGKVVK